MSIDESDHVEHEPDDVLWSNMVKVKTKDEDVKKNSSVVASHRRQASSNEAEESRKIKRKQTQHMGEDNYT